MARTYKIQSGDTLSGIGSRYGMNWRDIAKWNKISNPNMIYAGNTLNLYNPAKAQRKTKKVKVQPKKPIVDVKKRTPFSQVLPFDKVFNDQLVGGLAESQINPEITRQREDDIYNFNRNLAGTGGYRSGRMDAKKNSILDAYSRAQKEQVNQFTNQIKDYATDWYNRQEKLYNQNPSGFQAPKVDTFQEALKGNPQFSDAYNKYIGLNK